jgi:MarR family transcriptional regulator for hemolysin
MQKTRPLSIDIHDIEYLICHVGNLWRRLIGNKIKSLGICITEKRVLFAVARHPGLTQIQLANLLELEPQNLMRSLDKLEKLKWIEKKADQKDRRAKCLFVTDAANKVIAKIQKISSEAKPQILSGIDEKNLKKLVGQLGDIRENLFKELEL